MFPTYYYYYVMFKTIYINLEEIYIVISSVTCEFQGLDVKWHLHPRLNRKEAK